MPFDPGSRASVGSGSHMIEFAHPLVGTLEVWTGIDEISWGYSLNTQRWPTYGGEVVQILSAYVDDLQVKGTMQTYRDMETLYGYFLTYIQRASAEGPRNEQAMTFRYPHRGWTFKIIVTGAPGYRKARDLTVVEWQIQAHVVDDAGDVEALSSLIVEEAQIKAAIGADNTFAESFGLEGKIRFVDENPFSDPWTDHGIEFDANKHMDTITDFYSKLLPSYLEGDFETIFGGIGSKPSFQPTRAPKGSVDKDEYTELQAKEADRIIEAQKIDKPNG